MEDEIAQSELVEIAVYAGLKRGGEAPDPTRWVRAPPPFQ